MVTVCICSKLKTSWERFFLQIKSGRNLHILWVFLIKQIPLMLVGSEMIIANSVLCASFAIYHLISGRERGETAVFAGYWCTQLTFFLFLGVGVKNLTIWHSSKHDFHWKDEKKIFQHSTWKKSLITFLVICWTYILTYPRAQIWPLQIYHHCHRWLHHFHYLEIRNS